MRRCPVCQAANPSTARFCHACGSALPPVEAEPWFRLDDLWSPEALRRGLLAALLLLAYRLSFGGLLSAGPERQESRFLIFHVGSGLVLALGLAWARRERGLNWLAWALGGLAGGLLCEALEVWYSYRHLMGTLTFYAFQWFGLPTTPPLIYQILQGLRAAGLALPLLALASTREKRFGYSVFALLWTVLAVVLRVPVRGFFLAWGALSVPEAWTQVAYYLGSALALAYGLGARRLTPRPPDR
jgi:hypothetical protein